MANWAGVETPTPQQPNLYNMGKALEATNPFKALSSSMSKLDETLENRAKIQYDEKMRPLMSGAQTEVDLRNLGYDPTMGTGKLQQTYNHLLGNFGGLDTLAKEAATRDKVALQDAEYRRKLDAARMDRDAKQIYTSFGLTGTETLQDIKDIYNSEAGKSFLSAFPTRGQEYKLSDIGSARGLDAQYAEGMTSLENQKAKSDLGYQAKLAAIETQIQNAISKNDATSIATLEAQREQIIQGRELANTHFTNQAQNLQTKLYGLNQMVGSTPGATEQPMSALNKLTTPSIPVAQTQAPMPTTEPLNVLPDKPMSETLPAGQPDDALVGGNPLFQIDPTQKGYDALSGKTLTTEMESNINSIIQQSESSNPKDIKNIGDYAYNTLKHVLGKPREEVVNMVTQLESSGILYDKPQIAKKLMTNPVFKSAYIDTVVKTANALYQTNQHHKVDSKSVAYADGTVGPGLREQVSRLKDVIGKDDYKEIVSALDSVSPGGVQKTLDTMKTKYKEGDKVIVDSQDINNLDAFAKFLGEMEIDPSMFDYQNSDDFFQKWATPLARAYRDETGKDLTHADLTEFLNTGALMGKIKSKNMADVLNLDKGNVMSLITATPDMPGTSKDIKLTQEALDDPIFVSLAKVITTLENKKRGKGKPTKEESIRNLVSKFDPELIALHKGLNMLTSMKEPSKSQQEWTERFDKGFSEYMKENPNMATEQVKQEMEEYKKRFKLNASGKWVKRDSTKEDKIEEFETRIENRLDTLLK